MRKKNIFWLISVLLLLPVSVLSAEPATVIYYYGDTCAVCLKLVPYIDSIRDRFPGIKFEKKEVWKNKDNAVEFYRSAERLNIPRDEVCVPFLIIGDTSLLGFNNISEKADGIITQETGIARTSEFKPNFYSEFVATFTNKIHRIANVDLILGNERIQDQGLSILPITAAAIADSVNPCAILVLIVLLAALIMKKSPSKIKIVATAASFISAVYIAYLLVGLGLVSALGTAVTLAWFYSSMGSLAVIVGLANIKDGIKPGAFGFVTEIPRAWRPTLMKYLIRATSPLSAFIVGFLVTLFELPCTGGPYLFAVSLLADKLTTMEALPWLLYYNLIFIAPLVIISFLVIIGKNIEIIEMWQQKNLRMMHLVSGSIMLPLGLWLILSRI